MSNKPDVKGRNKHLVPVYGAPDDKKHNIKYLILNEEPKEYICEHGCVHEYPQHLKVQRRLAKSASPKRKRSPMSISTRENSSLNSYRSLSKSPKDSSSDKNIKKTLEKIPKIMSKENMCLLATPIKPVPSGLKLLESSKKGSLSPYYNSSYRPSSCVRRDNSTTELKMREKEYDKNDSDVYSRLYPYKPKAKGSLRDIQCSVKMDWNNYHRLQVIYAFMDDLEKTYPSLCTVGVVGKSVEGRDLKLLKISNGDANNSAVWIDAGIHAREWIAPAVNTFIANYLAHNFDKLPKSCKNKDWYFMPVVNADGYEYSHTKCRMWRKNRAWFGNKCVGVDINRNFSIAWGGKGSSGDPEHNFFRGSAPFSEPEACALKNVLLEAKLPFKVYLTLHAFGEVIIFPFAHSDDLCPDYVRLLHGATVMSRAIYDTNGTIYRVGVSKDVMYRASGTSNDWCYGAVGIPWCYLIELRSKKHRFKLPEEEIKETSHEILNCVLALMEYVDKYPVEQNAGDFTPRNKRH